MKKLAAALAVLIVAAAAGAGYYLYKHRESGDVRGSSTEFNTTESIRIPPPPPPKEKIIWPEFGYDSERSHVGPTFDLRPPFTRVWTAGGASLLEFPPAIAYGRLYVADGGGRVLAVSTKTGARAWSYNAHRCQAASPAVGDYKHGTVYEVFLNRIPCAKKNPADGEIVALEVGKGRLRWRTHIGASETSPVIVGNRLYVGDWQGNVYAIDARTGQIEWTAHTNGAVKGGVAVSGNRLYVGSYDGHVYAFDARNGHRLWRASGDSRLFGHGRFYSTPSAAYGRVYIGSTDGKVYSFGATSGKRRWSHSTGGFVYGSPAIWNQLVLVGSYSHRFYAFDAATGDIRWSFQANGPISGSATVINGVVYFATLSQSAKHGRTYALNARNGKLLWTFPDGKYTPVVADKSHLFVVGYAKLYGFVPRR
jgi:outer membrane protein assembly factor BamB